MRNYKRLFILKVWEMNEVNLLFLKQSRLKYLSYKRHDSLNLLKLNKLAIEKPDMCLFFITLFLHYLFQKCHKLWI